MEMKNIRLVKRLWNSNPDDVLTVDEKRAEFAIRKGYAIEVEKTENMKRVNPIVAHIREKADEKPIKNKAEKAPKNK